MITREFLRKSTVAAAACSLLVTLPIWAEDAPREQQEKPSTMTAEAQRAAMKAHRQAQDERQRRDYLRSVPSQNVPHDIESDVIKMRTLRQWHLLTYPTGTMPTMPYNRAKSWIDENVADAPVWRGGGIELPAAFKWQTKALVNPDENTWTAVGPAPLDSVGTTNNAFIYGTVSGRVGAEALAVDPNNTSVAYAGFVAGGLWKTTNLGSANVTWTPLWDDLEFVTQGVSSVTIDPTDSQTVYVGTGDWAAGDQFSAGIMKTTDGGATWTQLGASVFTPYSQTLPATGNRWSNQNIKTIQIDPKNNQTLLVGTRYDLYLSNDAGVSWEICGFGNNYTQPDAASISTINRVSDIYLDDRGSSTVAYVAIGFLDGRPASALNGNNGVYRFTIPAVGCPSWPSDFTTLFSGMPAGTGSGVNGHSTGRIELAAGIGSDNGLTLYAQVEDAVNLDNEGTFVLRPDGGSTTWSLLSGSTSYGGCSTNGTGQDWYDLFIGVDPNDDKTLYIGHIDVYKATVGSSYGSMTQTNLTDVYGTSCANYGKVHPDQHAITFIGNTSDFLVGNDGGVYYNDTGDASGWQQINESFNTNQFYAGQIGANFANGGNGNGQWLFGGLQDNGNASWDSSQNNDTWIGRSVGGDGFFVTFDPINGSETGGIWMTEYTFGSMYASTSGANGPFSGKSPVAGCEPSYSGSPDWSTPFMLDTLHCTDGECENYIAGGDHVYAATRFSRGCPSWTQVSGSLVKTASGSIITVGMAPSEPKASLVGTSDGNVWWTGSAFSGSSCTQAAANSSSFGCSTNSGASWLSADASNTVLPNRAVLQVAFDPQDHNLFYAAVGGFNTNTPTTPGHVFAMTQSGGSISVADKTGNLPDVPASAVAVNPHNRKQVYIGTHFGFFYTDDIDAASPIWVRYNTGLPNTVIAQLTIDRGPDTDPLLGTTLAAFTYGRGVYVLKLPTTSTGNNSPTADFSYSCTDLGCNFTDLSSDSDGTIASWAWTFGDGNGSSAQNPSHTFGAGGTYTVGLTVTDDLGATGNTSQQVTVTAPGGNNAPTADFSYSCTDLGCNFTDLSSDSDGTVASWAWTFGDSNGSSAQNPSHTYGASGTYTVGLTVTDDLGATGITSQQVTVTAPSGGISLSTSGYKVKGTQHVDLTWSGATTNVDIIRDGVVVISNTANDGAETENLGVKGGGSYVYQVCETGTSTCSNTSNVVF